MTEPRPHMSNLTPCPFLPEPGHCRTHECVLALGEERGPRFYETSLRLAASLWLEGLPARSLLQINRAFAADLPDDERVLRELPPPYAAVAWIIIQRPEGHFIGNPRRHFQHLASRMVEPRKEIRAWRAWACWWLSRQILPESEFPADEEQLRKEKLLEPSQADIAKGLANLGWPNERDVWAGALGLASSNLG